MADFTNKDGQQLIPQEYNEEKWAKAAAAARDMIEYSEMSGLYKLYTLKDARLVQTRLIQPLLNRHIMRNTVTSLFRKDGPI